MAIKKGFILTLDMIIAIFITGLFVGAALLYTFQEDNFSHLNMNRMTNDIMLILDQEGILQGLDQDTIETALLELKPIQYDMRLYVYTTEVNPVVIVETSTQEPENQFITKGQWFFLSDNGTTSRAEYYTWVR